MRMALQSLLLKIKYMHTIICRLIAALLLITTFNLANAVEEDGRAWLNLQANGATGIDHLRWYMELQPRYREESRERDQLIIRPALYYQLDKMNSVWLGYAYVRTFTDNPLTQREHRYWQQFAHEFAPIYGMRLRSFTRLEQRTFEGTNDTGHKIRQRLMLNIPFENHANLSTLISEEYHHNLNDTDYGARSGFDQNRLFAGLAWVISPSVSMETGYLNQYIRRRNEDAMNHVFSTTLYFKFD